MNIYPYTSQNERTQEFHPIRDAETLGQPENFPQVQVIDNGNVEVTLVHGTKEHIAKSVAQTLAFHCRFTS
jgi:hypothetical protein